MEDLPLVTIKCLVYNHEPYLRQCLDGFVMQKTNFRFEAWIHDDASTDRSAEIIREYAKKYPEIIKPYYEKENLYSKHDQSFREVTMNPKYLRGKYIAFCEGDDYWRDEYKLQKQVDFLEAHEDYVVCCHDYLVLNQSTGELKANPGFVDVNYQRKGSFNFLTFNYFDGWYTSPLTCMFRNGEYVYHMPTEKFPYFIDTVFYYYLLKHGKGALLKDRMAVYRVHSGGIYSGASSKFNYYRNISNLTTIYKSDREKRILPLLQYNEIEYIKILISETNYLAVIREFFAILTRMPVRYFFSTIKYFMLRRNKNHHEI